jgi:Raf kinase inhibitor-like YbhB/YbcL family protein
VSSAAFDDGGTIPTQFTCDGAGVSPPITWSGVPAGAASVALVVEDPDAPSRTFVHWVVAGLPGADGTLPEGAGDPGISGSHTSSTSVPPPDLAGTVSALNSAGRPGWTPPCPPSGTHHYRFTVYVLPTGPPFPAGSAAGPAVAAITAAATAHGSLTGIYARGG